eukprot:TRINITY_DN43422_c0_g1_i2.p1 TRINITY_DN43422_c0_g1~~TRINITY_DN43422_c0_g1_i2.p1  ORF type:complete len:260 (-),score=40.70 TRINITY_DN43422_c0_g1_i2:163-942(-)
MLKHINICRRLGDRGAASSRLVDVPSLKAALLASKGSRDVLHAVESYGGDWDAISLATAWHRLAKVGNRPPGDAKAVAGHLDAALASTDLSNFRSREIATIVWAWGKLRLRRHEQVQLFCDRLVGRLPLLKAQDISNMVYGMAQANTRPRRFLQSLAHHLPSRLPEFKAQELANVVYAFALLHFKDRGFLQSFCDFGPCRLQEMSEQDLSLIVYSLGRLSFLDEAFMAKAASCSRQRPGGDRELARLLPILRRLADTQN